MEQGMVTRRRAALCRRKLLHLPDELLSMIVMETMWECTLEDKSPDLVSYQRRLTNHPSVQLEKVAFLGGICGRLRGICKELVHVPARWTSPDRSKRETYSVDAGGHVMPTLLPSSITCDELMCATFVREEIGYLSLLPTGTLARLDELELYGRGSWLEDDFALQEILSHCTSLKTLKMDCMRLKKAGEAMRVLEAVTTLRQLQHLTMHSVHDSSYSLDNTSVYKLFEGTWTSHVTRLEVAHTLALTWSHFIKMMGCVQASISVALFTTWNGLSRQDLCQLGELVDFPALWRLSITFHNSRNPPTRSPDSTPAGREQLAVLSPLEIVKHAPLLEYLNCSERLDVQTPAELAEVAKLVDREGWKHLRLGLKTWEGDKGARWTAEEKQDVFVG